MRKTIYGKEAEFFSLSEEVITVALPDDELTLTRMAYFVKA